MTRSFSRSTPTLAEIRTLAAIATLAAAPTRAAPLTLAAPLIRAAALTLAAVVALAAASPAAAQDYYSDIRPVLVENCMRCHSDQGIGWSMEDPEQTYMLRHAIAAAVLERRMPPWLAEPGHQRYVDDLSLATYVIDLVREWRDDDFPKGEPRPDPAPASAAGGHGAGSGFRPDVSVDVLPGGSYMPNQSRSDDYRCFVVDWPGDESTYVTGFRAVPGNTRVAHHLVVHAVSPEMKDRFRELEAEEEGAGYQCFGGAVPDRLGRRAEREAYESRYPEGIRQLSLGSFWLAHWAPGMDGHHFPEGTGIRVDPGSALVVQMHYYGGAAPGESDAGTRMEFTVAAEVERPAFHYPQTRNAWLAGERNGSMVIEPGRTATYETSIGLGDMLAYVTRVTQVEQERIQALEVHSANLHMHAIGHSGEIALTDRNGRRETLLSVPRWDLRWQRDFTLAEPKVFSRQEFDGTRLTVRCTFRNPHDAPVYGGYGSDEEMCFNFSYIAVRTGEPTATEP
ncbi:MAG: hypothetical protein ACOC8B_00175 [Gemmatimonadota bacterium]